MNKKYRRIKLKEIATIRTGCNLNRYKRKLDKENSFIYKVLLTNAITEYGIANENFCEEYELKENIKGDFFTKSKDIIMMLREPNTASFIKGKEGLLVSSFNLIIRVDHSKVDHRYLSNYLNSSIIKKQLLREVGVARISTVNKSAIDNFEIYLPPLKEQKKIAELMELQNEELLLLKEIQKQKEILYKEIKNKIFK